MMKRSWSIESVFCIFFFFLKGLYKMHWILNITANQIATGSFLVLFLYQSCKSFVVVWWEETFIEFGTLD